MSLEKKIHYIDSDSQLSKTIEKGNVGDIINLIPGNQLARATYIIVEKEDTDDSGNLLKDDKGNVIIIKDVDLLSDAEVEMEMAVAEKSGGRKTKTKRKMKTKRNKTRLRKRGSKKRKYKRYK